MNKRDLLKKKNVVIVYTGKKVTGGVETDRDSLRVGVTQKIPLAQLAKEDVVPQRVKGIETDVFETEEIAALSIDRKSRVRPAPGGVSIGHPKVTAGTLGMIVKKGGFRYILSNNHVLANCNDADKGDQSWQPGAADGGGPADTIAHLADFVPIHFSGESNCPIARAIIWGLNGFAQLFRSKTQIPHAVTRAINKVDCAISRPIIEIDISQEILGIGKVVGYAEAKKGDEVTKSGRTTELTAAYITGTDGLVNINYGAKTAIFDDQIVTPVISKGGDSGSVLVNEKNEAVGLLFAGSSSLTIANKISNVIEALGLDKEVS